MSRNGSGQYSLPVNSWNPAVNGVSATSADYQALVNDIATALTGSVAADGQTPMTGPLAMGGNKISGLAAASVAGDAVRFQQVGAVAITQGAAASGANADITSMSALASITAAHTKHGRNANNLGLGLQIGGGDASYGSNGILLSPDGNNSWLRFQPSLNESALEVLLYSAGAQGRASAAIGTNQVTRVSGTLFSTSWVGKKFYLGDTIYRVATVPTSGSMTVTTEAGGAVLFASNFTETFHVCYVSGTGTCTVASGVVTRTTGDPFIPFIASPYVFKLGSTAYTVTAFTDINTQTISSPPANGTYAYTFETDINNQMVTLRVQKVTGDDEENLSIYADYKGYHLRSFFAGSGELRPIFIGSSSYTSLVAYDNGDTTIGGEYGADAIRVLAPVGTIANRLETIAAAAGVTPAWRARGTDTNVGMGFDTKGTGSFTFTSNSFGKTEFQIFGDSGDDWLTVGSATGTGTLSAAGGSADVDIRIAPKGAGRIWVGPWTSNVDAAVNGYALMKDSGGTLRKFATIA